MKICNAQAMKMIKEYEEQKRLLISQEDECCTTMYKEGESPITNGYDYDLVRNRINELDSKIRNLRVRTAQANNTVVVVGFNITIGEALVMLAQLQSQKMHVESLARKKQLSRRLTPNGIIEFTECLYLVEKAKEDVKKLREQIGSLQIAIDKANLTNEIEM